MNLEMITIDEQLSPEVKEFIKEHFTGKDPRSVINDAVKSYKLFEAGMGEIDKFRDKYNNMWAIRKLCNQLELAENTNDAVLKLCKMSDAQAKMQLLVLMVTAKLGQQQTMLVEQQRQIKNQTERISSQQGQIEGHQEKLEEQNQKLIEQQKRLEIQAQRLQDDNIKLIEASDALKALRSIGQEHDDEIVKQNKALSELESFYIKLRQTLQDMDDAEGLQDRKIDQNANRIAENRSAIAKMDELGRKLDDLVTKNFEDDKGRDKELARQRDKDEEHDAELGKLRKKNDEHDHLLKELSADVELLHHTSVPMWLKVIVFLNLILSVVAIGMTLMK